MKFPFSVDQLDEKDRDTYKQLLQKIQSCVPVIQTTTEIAGFDYPWLKVIDPDQLLENALTRTDRSPEELDPFWAATWRAAIGLDRYLEGLSIRGRRVLELGCGSGRAGIAAAIRGANVFLTDAACEGLMVAEFNAYPVRANAIVTRLQWSDETLPDQDPFPLIIGSDIVYDPKLWPILEPCLRRHLAPEGRVILTEPHRQTGDRFIEWIQEREWHLRASALDLMDGQREIRVMELSIPKR